MTVGRVDVADLGVSGSAGGHGEPERPPALDWRAVLDLEVEFQRRRPEPSAKARAIRERFGVSVTRFYGRLFYVLDWPEVHAYAPAVVSRLRRIRDQRRRARWVDRVAV
jgi:hypothetical protein